MSIKNWLRNAFTFERDRNGNTFYTLIDSEGFVNSEKYLDLSLCNPVLLTIISLRSKIFSQMRITHQQEDGTIIENSEYVKLLNTPNFFQSQEDFLYQLMWFQSATGTNLTYQIKARTANTESEIAKSIYNLIPSDVDFKNVHKINSFITTEKDKKAYGEKQITYCLDNEKTKISLKDIIPFYDLSNGLIKNSFMHSPSRVKGISKVLENIDENIKSKNVNLKFSQKYLAKNKNNMQGVATPIQEADRKTIEKVLWSKTIQITNNDIEVKHLVSDFKKLFLDEMLSNDATTCLNAFEMNRDMLNYFSNGASTHENQEQGFLRYLQNSTQTDADSTMNSFSQQWGLFDKGEKLVASYDHLPIMQSVMNAKIKTLSDFQNAMKSGIENQTITVADAKAKTTELMKNLKL
jgi:hypothetical protein